MQKPPLKALEKNIMYKLIVTELSNEDLEKIVSYIVNDLCNPAAATNLLNEIERCYSFLKANPLMY